MPTVVKPRTRKPDKRTAITRQTLRNALIELLAGHNFSEINALMIVQRAGIGYATFFRHYESPEALLIDVAEQMHEEVLAAMAASIFDAGKGRDAVRIWSDYVRDHRDVAYAMYVNAGPFIQRAMAAQVTQTLRQSLADLKPRIPVDLAVRHAVDTTITILTWWLETGRTDPSELAELFSQLVVSPLAQLELGH